jgi:hypothetical protein
MSAFAAGRPILLGLITTAASAGAGAAGVALSSKLSLLGQILVAIGAASVGFTAPMLVLLTARWLAAFPRQRNEAREEIGRLTRPVDAVAAKLAEAVAATVGDTHGAVLAAQLEGVQLSVASGLAIGFGDTAGSDQNRDSVLAHFPVRRAPRRRQACCVPCGRFGQTAAAAVADFVVRAAPAVLQSQAALAALSSAGICASSASRKSAKVKSRESRATGFVPSVARDPRALRRRGDDGPPRRSAETRYDHMRIRRRCRLLCSCLVLAICETGGALLLETCTRCRAGIPARSASTGVALRQLLSLAQSRIDQVEAEIPEVRISEIQTDHLDEPLWIA